MATVEQLIAEFAEELRTSGDANPNKYLQQVEGADRRELAALIDAAIERVPRRKWDAAAFRGSLGDRASRSIAAGMEAEAEPLAELRMKKQVPRDDLISRLADLLGVGPSERKVGRYYHQLERGILPAEGVSWSVFDALGKILGESAARVRTASRLGPGTADAGGESVAFARQASPAPGYPSEAADRFEVTVADQEWDEVDELFRGGERGVSD